MRWIATAAALLASGCSLLASLGDLSSGADDAGADRADATFTGDAATDGDAGKGGEAGGPFCLGRTPAPTFCKDFDSQRDVDDGWDFHGTAGGPSTIELDRGASTSPPVSLRVALPAGAPGTGSGFTNRLGMDPKPGAAATKRAHYEVDVRLDAADPEKHAYLSTLGFGQPASYALILWGSATTACIQEDLSNGEHITTPFTRAIPMGVWTHVDLDVDFTSSPAAVTA
jgi:hypothetical protein